MAVTQQERYSALVDAKLRYTIVQKNGFVWNNKYEGNPKAGAVKVPVRNTEVTAAAYNKSTGASHTNAAGTFATVTIDKDYAVNEYIDNFDAESVPDNIVADRLDSAGYSLALQMNTDGTSELLNNSTSVNTTAAITKTTIYEKFVDVRTAMSKAKIPSDRRFALINPDFVSLLLKSPEFISASDLGDEVKQAGAIGQLAGFTCFEDATLPTHCSAICGHPDWCCRVEEWAVEPHVQDLSGSGTFIGASAVQGRKIYAHKVTKPVAVQVIAAVLDGSIAIASHTATITLGTNATGAKYRIQSTAGTWGDWTTYNSSSKPTTAANETIEAYCFDADGVRAGVISAVDA